MADSKSTSKSGTKPLLIKIKTNQTTPSKATIKDEEEEDDDEPQYYSFSGTFWKGIQEYIVPFQKADLDFCDSEKMTPPDQKLFQIPNLGTHYKEIWHQEDQVELQEIQQQGQELYSGTSMQTRQLTSKVSVPKINEDMKLCANMSEDMMSEKKDANKPVRCGDITSRILSALIEDQLVPAHLLTNSYSGSNSFQNAGRNTSESNLALPANASGVNQQQTMQEIDDRLKKEVLSLGLIDQSAINKIHLQKEDDEICRELKKVQNELLEKQAQNKQRRAKYLPLIRSKMEEQEQDRKIREEMKRLEESLTKNLKNMKKRKRAPSSSSKSSFITD
jgi:transcriptional adapter 3